MTDHHVATSPIMCAALLFAGILTTMPSVAQDPAYELIDLSTLAPHESSAGVQVNAAGQFVLGCWDSLNFGYFWNDENEDGEPDPSELISLGDLGNGNTQVNGLNDSGVVIGASRNTGNDVIAFRWTRNGGIQGLQTLAGMTAIAYGINNNGVIVGTARHLPLGNGASRMHAAMWMPDGTITDITPVGDSFHTVAIDIKHAGHIAGQLQDLSSAWVLRDGGTFFLGGGAKRTVNDINNADSTVCGTILNGGDLSATTWIWDGSAYAQFPLPEMSGFIDSAALSINEEGVVVGYIENDSGEERAVMWMPGEGPVDLNNFIDPNSGWVLRRAYSINDDGTIIGFGDLDGDPFSAFMLRPESMVDTDGDGLYDSWETDGLDINDDGIIDLDLPAMGADPMHKDLFLEVDVMQNVTLENYAVERAVECFYYGPSHNPDGTLGINLHIDMATADTFPFQQSWDDDFVNFGIVKAQYFGTIAERNDPNWEHIRAARQRVFRYAAIVNGIDNAGGWGELPGNDFYMVAGGGAAGDAHWQAVTFIHELGHNLGLRHGGGDDVNNKPNYISVMNYGFHHYLDASNAKLLPEFSWEALQPLIENNLDETIGITSGYTMDTFALHGYRNPGEAPQWGWVRLNNTQFDWNRDGQVEQGVIVDLNWFPNNNPSPGETMNGFSDWPTIEENLPIGTEGNYADGQHVPPPFEEETYEDVAERQALIPPPPINLATFEDLNVVFGESLEGELSDLVASDQQKLKLRSQPGFSAVEPDLIRLTVGAMTDIENPATLGLVFEGRLTHPNGQSRLLLKNWSTGQLVQQTQFTLGFTEEQKFVKDIPAADYVRADDGRIEVVVHQFVIAVFSALGFDSHIDRLEVSVTPE